MMFRTFLQSFQILFIVSQVYCHREIESEDYYFPLEPKIDFCKLSALCKHDFIPLCGQDTLGITRSFADNCDLYEYNCDEKKQYRHVGTSKCSYEIVASPQDK